MVVLQQLPAFGVFTVAAVKDVERAVVPGVLQVLHVVLHLHLHRVAVVVLPALELLVAVFALESLQSPFFSGGPALLAVLQDDGLVGSLEALDELFRTEMAGVHTLYVVLKHSIHQITVHNEGAHTEAESQRKRTDLVWEQEEESQPAKT